MFPLKSIYTSDGSKFFAHQEVMRKLQNKQGQAITTHVMVTDICNHKCAFCSVQHRVGDSLPFDSITSYLDILIKYGLKSVILSGGGNPILYKCPDTGKNFNDVVDFINSKGLEIGLITNGMPLVSYGLKGRYSWRTVKPSTLDKITWIRISMSGLDHEEREVYVPDIDSDKTTLGFSYVAHDEYLEPLDRKHGKVSRQLDLIGGDKRREPTRSFESRIEDLTFRLSEYCFFKEPKYLRLLPNCLEPEKIRDRCNQLEEMAKGINIRVKRDVAFVQYKPPAPPTACYLGYIHPVLNCDGFVYPCDSCVLNESAGHAFSNPWRICHWSEVDKLYEQPVRSLISDPSKLCQGCVFTRSNEILGMVVDGAEAKYDGQPIEHVNFV